MIHLAPIFQSGMTLQRDKPCRFWGTSDAARVVTVAVNGNPVGTWPLPRGSFTYCLPAQPAMEGATVSIGEVVLENVDFGEVWLAGGQSNMEFAMKHDCQYDEALTLPPDPHLRCFEVGKYSFAGEKEEKLRFEPWWDQWRSFSPETMGNFSAAATWFALELRRTLDVPVAIIGCNWGGTSASAWMPEEDLAEELSVYLQDYENQLASLDMDAYLQRSRRVRARENSPESKAVSDYMMKNTITMEEVMSRSVGPAIADGIDPADIALGLGGGPHDPWRPCGLYQTMLSTVTGCSLAGVLWYQGESDAFRHGLYARLFGSLIRRWRTDWQEALPFLYVQLAPFGTWLQCTGEDYPHLRRQQRLAADTIPGIYMVSSSDCGHRLDIHPKNKQPIGHRLALAARKYIYGEDIPADAPEGAVMTREDDTLTLIFRGCSRLSLEGSEIHALEIFAGGVPCTPVAWELRENQLLLQLPENTPGDLRVEFAQTDYYEVNLYNEAHIPAIPFSL